MRENERENIIKERRKEKRGDDNGRERRERKIGKKEKIRGETGEGEKEKR